MAVIYGTDPAPRPGPGTVAPLAAPPRPVPAAYRLATFDWSWTEAFVLFLVGVAPVALYVLQPWSRVPALVVCCVGVAAFRLRRWVRRTALLRWGAVATVTGADVVSVGTYYSGVTYGNSRLRQADGWLATTRWYTGPGTTTDVHYTLDGTAGTLRLRGLPYVGGVVLADTRRPQRALCVSQFPYELLPGPDGRWPGTVGVGVLVGVVFALVLELTLLAVTVLALVR